MDSAFRPGDVAPRPRFDRYELVAELGRGGMGVVYRARDTVLDRTVALKVMKRGLPVRAVDRLVREARAAAALQHPNVVRLHDAGQSSDGQPYLILQFVDGRSLDVVVEEEDVPPARWVVWLREIADALDHAHRAGLVHRDVKPQNILIDRDGTALLTDFGLVKVLDAQGQTRTGEMLGTPSYMAPEQFREAKHAGPPADIYGLGAIMYRLLTGRPPYRHESIGGLIAAVLHQPPDPPWKVRPSADPDLSRIALRCLEKKPARRYATAGELADLLGDWLEEERRYGPGGRPKRRPPIGATRWIAAGIIVVLLAVIAAGWLSRGERYELRPTGAGTSVAASSDPASSTGAGTTAGGGGAGGADDDDDGGEPDPPPFRHETLIVDCKAGGTLVPPTSPPFEQKVLDRFAGDPGLAPIPTVLRVEEGETVVIRARDGIQFGHERETRTNPNGQPYGVPALPFLLDDAAVPGGLSLEVNGALVAWIGDEPPSGPEARHTARLVGAGDRFVAWRSGRIWFGVNDYLGCYYDNKGRLDVDIWVGEVRGVEVEAHTVGGDQPLRTVALRVVHVHPNGEPPAPRWEERARALVDRVEAFHARELGEWITLESEIVARATPGSLTRQDYEARYVAGKKAEDPGFEKLVREAQSRVGFPSSPDDPDAFPIIAVLTSAGLAPRMPLRVGAGHDGSVIASYDLSTRALTRGAVIVLGADVLDAIELEGEEPSNAFTPDGVRLGRHWPARMLYYDLGVAFGWRPKPLPDDDSIMGRSGLDRAFDDAYVSARQLVTLGIVNER